jgi:hypothetical protein
MNDNTIRPEQTKTPPILHDFEGKRKYTDLGHLSQAEIIDTMKNFIEMHYDARINLNRTISQAKLDMQIAEKKYEVLVDQKKHHDVIISVIRKALSEFEDYLRENNLIMEMVEEIEEEENIEPEYEKPHMIE